MLRKKERTVGIGGHFRKGHFVQVTRALRPGRICKYCEEHPRQRKQLVQTVRWGRCGMFREKEAGVMGAGLVTRRR